MPDEKPSVELLYPLAGVNLATEFGLQPVGTTPVGVNVRAVEAITRRARGGSRCGLSKYAAQQVGGTSLIQMLAVIVDPTTAALLPDFPPGYTGPLTADPTEAARNPFGREVRTGGSGVSPSKNKPTSIPPLAVDDDVTFTVGDAAADQPVLLNDTYKGTPTIVITGGPLLSGASAEVTGSGSGSQIRYTPPSSGSGGTDTITYRLTATGNTGDSTAALQVTVNGGESDPHEGATYTGGGMGFQVREDSTGWGNRLSITVDNWNGMHNVTIVIGLESDLDVPIDDPNPALDMCMSIPDDKLTEIKTTWVPSGGGLVPPVAGTTASIPISGTNPGGAFIGDITFTEP